MLNIYLYVNLQFCSFFLTLQSIQCEKLPWASLTESNIYIQYSFNTGATEYMYMFLSNIDL